MRRVNGRFEIRNKLGMHARAAAVLVQEAIKYGSEIKMRKGELEVNAKSIMSVLQLAALQGEMVEVIAEGEDCEQALEALGNLIRNRFNEEE